MRVGLAMDRLVTATGQDVMANNFVYPGIPSLSSGLGFRQDRQGRYLVLLQRSRSLVPHPVGLPTALQEMRVELHLRELSSVSGMDGDADTPWHSQFFSPVILSPSV